MNVLVPISSIMSSKLHTVNPEDSLMVVKEIFDNYNIHHIPVVRYKHIEGIVSKTDFLHFLHAFKGSEMDKFIDETRLRSWRAEEIMTKGLAKVESTDPIRTALEVFLVNRFHAIPVVDNDELVGIVTTFDIIRAIEHEPIPLEDYKKAREFAKT
jgi:acetoin utilization protein AcuB